MRSKVNDKTFEGQTFYIGMDVHKKSWKVTILGDQFEHKTMSQDPDPVILRDYLIRNFPGATYKAIYESGFCDFSICRELNNLGINCGVVHAADVPTNHKEKMQKTDKADSRKLAKCLRSGEITHIHTPSLELEADRALVRLRFRLSKDLASTKIRVKSLLMQFGIPIPEQFTAGQTRSWCGNYMKWLSNLGTGEASIRQTLDSYLRIGESQRKEMLLVNRQIRELSKKPCYSVSYELLISIPGIGFVSAMTFLVQLGDIKRFKTLDELCYYVGLVPSMHGSGERMQVGKLINRGRKELKVTLIEVAWDAIGQDPALMAAFNELAKRMNRNKAIIRIARKILNRIRYVLINRTKYELGVMK
ncbi:Transposase [bacterium A37T11]|nr:Transposase [bacterium A37T11]